MSHSPFSPLTCSAAYLLESLRVLSSTTYKTKFNSDEDTNQLAEEARKYAARVGDTFIQESIKAGQLLEALLDNATNDSGRRYVACVIIATQGDKQLLQDVSLALLEHLLYPIKIAANGGTAPPPEARMADGSVNCMESTSQDRKALIKSLRRREDDRCPVTGLVLLGSELKSGEYWGALKVAHVIPVALDDLERRLGPLVHHAVTQDMIKNWCSIDMRLGKRFNSPKNAIFVAGDAHYLFQQFVWWFEPTDLEDEYVVCSGGRVAFNGKKVTFVDHSNSCIPLPDPLYFTVHAAFAKALYESGAGAYIDGVRDEIDGTSVLSPDGTSDIGFLLSSLVLGGSS